MILKKNNLNLNQIRQLSKVGRMLHSQSLELLKSKDIYEAKKYIKSLTGNAYITNDYARNTLLPFYISNLDISRLMEALKNNKIIKH